jgi:hypothetical protein
VEVLHMGLAEDLASKWEAQLLELADFLINGNCNCVTCARLREMAKSLLRQIAQEVCND